jgi:hypothetical protein
MCTRRKPGVVRPRRIKNADASLPSMTRLALALMITVASATALYGQDGLELVPPGWRAAPDEAGRNGRRFVSPDGSSWMSVYATPANGRRASDDPAAALGNASNERITYERRTRRFVAVSGYRGDRIFYRKSNVACRGTRWHTIALEYPASAKRKMDPIVTRIAHGMNDYDRDCGSEARSRG